VSPSATTKPPDPNFERNLRRWETAFKRLDFELEHTWHRGLFFWGFVAAAAVAYFQVDNDQLAAKICVALFGFVTSLAWCFANMGSKFWQSVWEKRVRESELLITGELYGLRAELEDKGLLRGWRFSVSRLAIALSGLSTVGWLCVIFRLSYDFNLYQMLMQYRWLMPFGAILLGLALALTTFSREKSTEP
jgi:hypothetical protein